MQDSGENSKERAVVTNDSDKGITLNNMRDKSSQKSYQPITKEPSKLTAAKQPDAAEKDITSGTKIIPKGYSEATRTDPNEIQATNTRSQRRKHREKMSSGQDRTLQHSISHEPHADDLTQLENAISGLSLEQMASSSAPVSMTTNRTSARSFTNASSAAFVFDNQANRRVGSPPASSAVRTAVSRASSVLGNSARQVTRSNRVPMANTIHNVKRPILFLLPRPIPTQYYLKGACLTPKRQEVARPLLIVMDLNGCLLDRGKSRNGNGDLRPCLQDLIEYCSKNHKVMIWSSATANNVKSMSSLVFGPQSIKPVAIWARDTLRLTPAESAQRVQVYKQLQWIWEDKDIAKSHPYAMSGGSWDQTNTILIDDSLEKAAAQPHNQLLLPEYKKENNQTEREEKVLQKVVEYLKEAEHYEDVSSFICQCSFQKWMAGDFPIAGSLSQVVL